MAIDLVLLLFIIMLLTATHTENAVITRARQNTQTIHKTYNNTYARDDNEMIFKININNMLGPILYMLSKNNRPFTELSLNLIKNR